MAKSVTLWGATYSNVPAIEVPSGNTTAKFIEPSPTTATASDVASGKIFFDSSGTQRTGSASGGGGNEFLVTFTKSGNSWVPDKTFSQTFTAYTNGKTICSLASNNSATSIVYDDDNDGFYVLIEEPFSDFDGSQYYNWGVYVYGYIWTSEGFDEDENSTYYATDMGTALPSDVASGKVFYNTTGIQVGAMTSGTEGTPTATKGTVSNHSISVTPSVTNTAGMIQGGTHTGTPVTVRASELVAGTILWCDDPGYWDVTNAETFVVAEGTAGTPTATKGSVSNHTINVTPSVSNTGGWITGGTKTGTAVSVSASELVSGNLAISQNGNNIDVTNYQTVSVSVSGGTSKNVQVHQSTSRATSSTYTNVNSLTCTKTAKYTVYWSTMRSSTSGTSGSQLYIGGSAYGTADTTTWSNHVQNMKLTSVQINANQAVAVYARSRGSNYYAYAPLLTIVEE